MANVPIVNKEYAATSTLPKFNADAKQRFLDFYEEHGLMHKAAQAAGVSAQCVRSHLKADEAFAEEFSEVAGRFKDMIEAEIRRRAIDGYDEYLTNKDGIITAPYYPLDDAGNKIPDPANPLKFLVEFRPVMQRRFSDGLLRTFAQRHIKDYTAKVDHSHTVQGGVLLIPAGQSVEEWQAAQNKLMEQQARDSRAPITIDNNTQKVVR